MSEASENILSDKAIQTRLRGRDMYYMITLKNVHEGSSVLIMWNNLHNTYMIFWSV